MPMGDLGVPLHVVLATDELDRRPHPTPEYRAENLAYLELVRTLASSPDGLLQKVSDTARQLCNADSAGISLLERSDGEMFRWHACSGDYAGNVWGTMDRHLSPCGVVVDQSRPLLMIRPERHFTVLADLRPTILETLLVPFSRYGEVVGTLWIVSHHEARRFHAEDLRILSNLTQFAGASYEMTTLMRDNQQVNEQLIEANDRLRRSNDALRAKLEGRSAGAPADEG
jgi:GAF domain-containing protein